jgi:hypothetical protein
VADSTINPNLIAAPKARKGGLGDRVRAQPFLTKEEADFVKERRAKGVSDAHIALMLGCSLLRIQRQWSEPLEPRKIDEPISLHRNRKVISADERRARDIAARNVKVWRP